MSTGTALKKSATSFVPTWMKAAPTAPVPPTEESTPERKLSSQAKAFVPKSQVAAAAPAAAPTPSATAAAKPQQPPTQQRSGTATKGNTAKQPSLPGDDSSSAPRALAPQGAWSARPPLVPTAAKVSPQSKPATSPPVKAVSPATKPRTPQSKPATPGQLYRSPASRPAEPSTVAAVVESAKATKLTGKAAEFKPRFFVPPMTYTSNTTNPPTASTSAAPTPAATTPAVAAKKAVPPTPPTAPTPPAGAFPLTRTWSLFYLDRTAGGTESFDPTLVYDIRSVDDFWRTVNNVPTVTNGAIGSTYYFFRDGIMPKWEDEGNAGGGAWTLRLVTSRDLEPDTIDEVWERLLCMAIGEAHPPSLKDNLVGLVAKMRGRVVTVQFWVKSGADELPTVVSSAIGEVYSAFKMDYLSHEASRVAALEREEAKKKEEAIAAAAAAKKKKKRTY